MNCLSCGSKNIETRKENMPLIGLPTITLAKVRVDRCSDCGEYEVEIPKHSRLTQVVTLALINKRSRLTGKEIRWCRAKLGWTEKKLAEHIGVSLESVSKWENEKANQTRTADRFIRLLLAKELSIDIFPLEALPFLSNGEKEPLKMRLKYQKADWKIDGDIPNQIVTDPTLQEWSLLATV